MYTKTCSLCKKTKSILEFYKKYKKKNKTQVYQSYCRECFNLFCINRWIQRKLNALKYKGNKCIKCGYNKNYAALTFHHLNPDEKDFDWNKLRLKSDFIIKKELDKCILVCCNCHSEIHNPNAVM